jgi:hypothetical protein
MARHVRMALAFSLLSLLTAGCGGAGSTATPAASLQPPTAAPGTAVPTAGTTTPVPTAAATTGTTLRTAYLGQPPPGTFPLRFAPTIIRGELHTPPVFMPDGTEAYWSRQTPDIQVTRLVDGRWTDPESVAFSASLTDYRDPFISPEGDRLYFLSLGRLPGATGPEKENIWYVERAGDGWGEPRPVDDAVNALLTHWQVSVADNRDLYFASADQAPLGDLYVSRYVDGDYVTPERLPDSINTDELEITPYIAPDGRYLLFSRTPDERSSPRLYVSRADAAGTWEEPALIGQVPYGLCPIVSPDGEYLFFLSSSRGVSWMATTAIEELRPR